MPLPVYKETRRCYKIAVAAGKGGVGKSTVTVQLALAFSNLGKRVGILDCDLYGPSLRRMLPEDRQPTKEGERLKPALAQGIPVISMAYFRPDTEAAAMRAPIANGIVQQFLESVDWPDLDILLFDYPPGTGDIQLTLSQKAELSGAIIVTTPQELAMMDVRKAMDLFDKLQVPIIGVVENMSYYLNQASGQREYLFGKGGGERLATETGSPFLGQIPLDPAIASTGDSGERLNEQALAPFVALAGNVMAHVESLDADAQKSLQNFELRWS